MLDHYGRQCACCGETQTLFLQLDHIDGGGNQHKKDQKITGGNGLAIWLYRHGFPPEFQILCANCNIGRHTNGGICPHKEEQNARQKAFPRLQPDHFRGR